MEAYCLLGDLIGHHRACADLMKIFGLKIHPNNKS